MLAESLPSSLLTEWVAFERVHGPILIHERLEAMVAVLCAVVSGKGADPVDFLPPWDEVKREEDALVRKLGRLALHMDSKGVTPADHREPRRRP